MNSSVKSKYKEKSSIILHILFLPRKLRGSDGEGSVTTGLDLRSYSHGQKCPARRCLLSAHKRLKDQISKMYLESEPTAPTNMITTVIQPIMMS